MHPPPNILIIPRKNEKVQQLVNPSIKRLSSFSNKDELNQCFEIIKELTDFANIVETTNQIALR